LNWDFQLLGSIQRYAFFNLLSSPLVKLQKKLSRMDQLNKLMAELLRAGSAPAEPHTLEN